MGQNVATNKREEREGREDKENVWAVMCRLSLVLRWSWSFVRVIERERERVGICWGWRNFNDLIIFQAFNKL